MVFGGAGGMQATEHGVVSFSLTSAPHALFMKKLLCVEVGYSEVAGGLRVSKGPWGSSGPLVPTRGPGPGVIGVMEPTGVEPPPATEVLSNVVGVGGMWGCETGMAAWRSRSSVVYECGRSKRASLARTSVMVAGRMRPASSSPL